MVFLIAPVFDDLRWPSFNFQNVPERREASAQQRGCGLMSAFILEDGPARAIAQSILDMRSASLSAGAADLIPAGMIYWLLRGRRRCGGWIRSFDLRLGLTTQRAARAGQGDCAARFDGQDPPARGHIGDVLAPQLGLALACGCLGVL